MVTQTSISSASSMAIPTIALRSSRVSRRPRSSQQSRAFRIGLWSSYLDPNFQKEIQRRHRMVKHKYIEALNRRLSWDRQLPDYAKNLGFKGFMSSARLRGRWINNDPFGDPKSELKRDAGNGIEDVEADALDRLKLKEDAMNEFIRAKSRMFHRNYGFSFGRGSETIPSEAVDGAKDKFDGHNHGQKSHSSSQEYEIDPITNRKVFKNTTNDTTANIRKPIQVPVKTFKGYRSQFSGFEPPATSTTEPTYQSSSSKMDSIHGSVKENSNESGTESKAVFGKQKDTNPIGPVEKDLKDFDAKYMHDEVRDKCNFIFQEMLKSQDPQASSRSAKSGSEPDPVQKGLKDFDEKMAYDEPFGSYKPSWKLPEKPDPVQEGLKSYDAKMSYDKPFMAYEPDGQPPAKAASDPDLVQDGLHRYDAKISYKPSDISLPYSMSNVAKSSNPVEDGLKKFDSRMCYGELNTKYPMKEKAEESPDPVQEGLKDFDSKMSYNKPHIVSDADGQSRMSEKKRSVWEFVKGYNSDRPPAPDAKNDRIRESLRSYENRYPYPESRTEYNTKDTKASKSDPVENGLKRYDSQHSYGPVYYNEPFAKPSKPAQPSSFVGSTPRKMTGNFVRDFPEEFETKWTPEKSSSGTLVPDDMKTPKSFENVVQNAEKKFIDGLASKESFSRNPDTPRIQPSLDRSSAQNPSIGGEKTRAKSRQETEVSSAKAVPHQGEGDLSVLVSSYGAGKRDKQPIERSTSDVHESVKPRGSQNLVNEVRSIYEEKYGTIDLHHRQNPEAASTEEATTSDTTTQNSEVQEPTLYKILAYDPTMQSVSIAETTSIVTDSASPLTPAEVLLRLSNPAKFFPHFDTLQSQGYEIVSGSGDVLIFRKVRAAAPSAPTSEPTPEPKRTSTNPIDGMQSTPIAATGNFASPTGFVNHDLPIRTEPVFKSNIDVRREEPVFSGKRTWYDESEKRFKRKTPGLGKRLITSAVWFSALAYATGVVFEYFKTGGVDGLGPQSF